MKRSFVAMSALIFVGACATEQAPTRAKNYADVVVERVRQAQAETRFMLRLNPSACECPPFEVKLGETWQRAEVLAADAEEPVVAALDTLMTARVEGRDRRVFAIEGRIEDTVLRCGRGGLYVSLVPTALVTAPTGSTTP